MLDYLVTLIDQRVAGSIGILEYVNRAAEIAKDSSLQNQELTPEGKQLLAKLYRAYFRDVAAGELASACAHVDVVKYVAMASG